MIQWQFTQKMVWYQKMEKFGGSFKMKRITFRQGEMQ